MVTARAMAVLFASVPLLAIIGHFAL